MRSVGSFMCNVRFTWEHKLSQRKRDVWVESLSFIGQSQHCTAVLRQQQQHSWSLRVCLWNEWVWICLVFLAHVVLMCGIKMSVHVSDLAAGIQLVHLYSTVYIFSMVRRGREQRGESWVTEAREAVNHLYIFRYIYIYVYIYMCIYMCIYTVCTYI